MTEVPDFPTTPGSLIRATACDDPRPSLYMLAAHDPADDVWVRPDLIEDPYQQTEITIIEVVHDEGRAQFIPAKPKPATFPAGARPRGSFAGEVGWPAGLSWVAEEADDGAWFVVGVNSSDEDAVSLRVDYAVTEAGDGSDEQVARSIARHLTGASLPGQAVATVQILTGEQARTELPNLFVDDPVDGQSFNEVPAHGNANWVDFWPDLLLVVRNPDGDVLMASNASRWHLEACGYGQNLPAEVTS